MLELERLDNDDRLDKNESEDRTPTQPGLARWKAVLLAFALIVGLIGLGLGALVEDDTSLQWSESTIDASPSAAVPDSFAAKRTTPAEPAPAPGIDLGDWSNLLTKLGFSFLIGFAIAYALSLVFRLAMLATGLLALALFGLEYAGIVTVQWGVLSAYWNELVVWLEPASADFRAFITGNLPAGGMAALGMLTGARWH